MLVAIPLSEVQKPLLVLKYHNSVGPLLGVWQYHFVILFALIVLRMRQGQNDIIKFQRNGSIENMPPM